MGVGSRKRRSANGSSDEEEEEEMRGGGREDKIQSHGGGRRHERKRSNSSRRDMERERDEEGGGRHKKRHRSRSGSESEDSEDDNRDKRHKREKETKEERDERRREKKRRKEKRRGRRRDDGEDDEEEDEEEEEEERRERRERKKKRKLLKEAKKYLEGLGKKPEKRKSKMVPVGDSFKFENISLDDYFNKNQEFSTWLKEEEGTFFSNLTSEESHSLFKPFVKKWNGGELSEKYYKGIEKAPRTGHDWSTKKALKTNVQDSLVIFDEDRRTEEREREKRERKRAQKDHELVLEEMLPKATGREALMEKKAIRRETNRNRDLSPEPMGEKDIMGGGDDFQKRLARERAWREKKATEKANAIFEKQSEYSQKEAATMNQFKELLNLAGGQIKIAKREDQPP